MFTANFYYGLPASRYKQHRGMQFLLFWLSVVAGTRMLYLLKRGSWLVNMKQVREYRLVYDLAFA